MYDRTNSEHHEDTGRTISLAPDLPAIPERLLLAHARGDVVFLCGAGVSSPAGLPDFQQLVRGVYRTLDPSIYEILPAAPIDPRCPPKPDCSLLTDRQTAEVRRFLAREFDVVLGMLERRLDSRTREDSKVRTRVIELLRMSGGETGVGDAEAGRNRRASGRGQWAEHRTPGANPPCAHPACEPRRRNDDHDHQLRPFARGRREEASGVRGRPTRWDRSLGLLDAGNSPACSTFTEP